MEVLDSPHLPSGGSSRCGHVWGLCFRATRCRFRQTQNGRLLRFAPGVAAVLLQWTWCPIDAVLRLQPWDSRINGQSTAQWPRNGKVLSISGNLWVRRYAAPNVCTKGNYSNQNAEDISALVMGVSLPDSWTVAAVGGLWPGWPRL